MNKKRSGLVGSKKNEQSYQGMPDEDCDEQCSQLSDRWYYAKSDNPVPIEVLEIEFFSIQSIPQVAVNWGQNNMTH